MKIYCALFALLLAFNELPVNSLTNLDGKPATFAHMSKKKANVIIFLSPECPLCQSYSLTLNNLYEKYQSKGIGFTGIIPGKSFSTAEVLEYRKRYRIRFPLFFDYEGAMVKYLKASVTPEAFVLDSRNKIAYQGRIDNWAYEIGKKRSVITEHNLSDALAATLSNQTIKTTQTKAIGCFIE